MCWNWTRSCWHFRIIELRESDKLHSSKRHLLGLILHLKNHQIDKAKWDAALLHSSNCKIYACSWYLDVVSPNWEALVTDNYEEIFPLTTKKKFTFQYLFTPFFVQQLGLFFAQKKDAARCKSFIKQLPKQLKLVELNLNDENYFDDEIWQVFENQNFLLPLKNNYGTLSSSYSTNHKRNIKKSKELGLALTHQASLTDIIQLFRNDRGSELKSFGKKQYQLFECLCDAVKKHAELMVLGVVDESKKLICGAVLFKFNNTITFIFSGNSNDGKKKGAMFFLIDEIIKMYCNQPLTLDFEGSNNVGLAQFYKGFGADKKSYLSIKRNSLPSYVRLFKK